MTVETSVKNKFCKACGADVRPSGLFCYSCGSRVAPESTNGNTSPEKIETSGQADAERIIAKPDAEKIADRPIEKPFAESIKGKNKTATVEKEEIKNRRLIAEKETALKTAAAVRRQAKSPPRKNIEVVWEQPQSSINIWFLITAGILILFAVGALLAMLYLR